MGNLGAISKLVSDIGANALQYAIFAAAVGTIVMALLELLKAALYARRNFHDFEIRRWVERTRSYSALFNALRTNPGRGSARWLEFIDLLTGGYASQRAVFEQPTEKLLAQIQAATNMALDFPDRYPLMYAFLTREASPSDQGADAASWRKAAELRRVGAREDDAAAATQLRAGAEARARLQNLVARQLDALQTEIQYRWSRGNQLVATAAGSALTLFVLLSAQKPADLLDWMLVVVASLLAGLVSPFAKDLVSGLSSFARQARA